MKDKKGLKFWIMVVITAAAVIYLGLTLFGGNAPVPASSQFKGPVGPPHMRGPSGPPPGGN